MMVGDALRMDDELGDCGEMEKVINALVIYREFIALSSAASRRKLQKLAEE